MIESRNKKLGENEMERIVTISREFGFDDEYKDKTDEELIETAFMWFCEEMGELLSARKDPFDNNIQEYFGVKVEEFVTKKTGEIK